MTRKDYIRADEQTNPRAHDRAPYALRTGAGRPEGRFDTLADAIEEAAVYLAKWPTCCYVSIVTVDGWWTVARVVRDA